MQAQPPILIRAELLEGVARVAEAPLTLVSAPGGCGKTTLLRRWRDDLAEAGRPVGWLSLLPLHADAGVFVEDLLDALRAALPEPAEGQLPFGESLVRILPHAREIGADHWARQIGRELRIYGGAPIVFLDGFERLPHPSLGHAIVDALLRLEPAPLQLVIATRGGRPDAATLRIADGHAVEIGADDLSLHTDQVEAVLRDSGIEPESELVAQLLSRTHGWAIALRLAGRALARTAHEDRRRFVADIGKQPDLFRYIGAELLGSASPGVTPLLETAALLGGCRRETLVAASGFPDADQRIDEAMAAGLLVPEGSVLGLHDLWAEWLRERLSQRADREAWLAVHRRVAQALEAEGRSERALEVLVGALPAPQLEDAIAELLSRRGNAWVSQGRHVLLQQALDALPAERRRREPGLLAVDGMLLAGSDPEQAIDHLKRSAAAYAAAGNQPAEFGVLSELAIIAFNENRSEEIRPIYRRALKLGRLVRQAPQRGFVVLGLAGGAMLLGRYGLALRFFEAAETYEHHPRERASIPIMQATIWAFQGVWKPAEEKVAAVLARPEQREHGTSYHCLQVARVASRVARGVETEAERAQLEESSEFFAQVHHSLNRFRAEYVLGQLLWQAGEREQALRHLERAAALGQRIGLREAEAAALGGIARLHQLAGDLDAARAAARSALACLATPKDWSSRFGGSPFHAAGVALAGCVAAEVGDVAEAAAFLDMHRRRLQHRELTLNLHTALVCRARVAMRAGDAAGMRKALQSAWTTLERAGTDHLAPELDSELRLWAVREAQALGICSDYVAKMASSLGIDQPRELWIRSFGGLSVERGGQRVAERTWRGATAKRLLMRLLAAGGTPLQRERIEADLWPDAPVAKAQNNLRVALSRLRDALELRRQRKTASPLIAVEGDLIGLTPDAIAAWDVTHWRRLLAEARAACDSGDETRAVEAAREAEALAREPFLPDGYDDWVIEERRALQESLIQEGRALSTSCLEAGRHRAAGRLARMVLAGVPDDEPSWELLVRSCLAEGDRAGARRALAEARDQLRRYLDVEPGPALQELAKRV